MEKVLLKNKLISGIKPNSVAELAGVRVGETLINVNGQDFFDIIDLSFLFADEELELLLLTQDGQKRTVKIYKDIDEEVGLEFNTAVFDSVQECCNNCIFCFINQMPDNMRDSLYVKDDDYRLSFLYGNFITLTNITKEAKERILSLKLTPLYVSVHATDGKVRTNLIKHRQAGDILSHMQELADGGIQFHTQVVLCPTYNDAKVLEKTFQDLFAMNDSVLSMAVVPVGLTKYRKINDSLRTFTHLEAKQTVTMISSWQEKCRKEIGRSFIYPSDEFYALAQIDLPEAVNYDGFPQYENGVGICRKFIDEWHKANIDFSSSLDDIYVVCGKSAENILKGLLLELTLATKVNYNLLAVENVFFGSSVTVTGLLTGKDILNTLDKLEKKPKRVIIPGIALRDEKVFLDDINIETFYSELPYEVKIANNATELKSFLLK